MNYQEVGIGVALELQSTGQNRKFINDIPPHLGSHIDPEDFHISVLYPDEIARSGLGEQEKERLPQLGSEILAGLGNVSIIGSEVPVVRNKLHPYKKFLGIEIDPIDQFCNDVRQVAVPLIFEHLGVRMPDFLPRGYHASVAYREGGVRRPVDYRRHFPEKLRVVGYGVGLRNVNFTTDGQPQDYVNDCFRNRRGLKPVLGRKGL